MPDPNVPAKVEIPVVPGVPVGQSDAAGVKYPVNTASAGKDDKGRVAELEGALSRMIQHFSDVTHQTVDEVRKKFHPDHQPKPPANQNANQQVKK